MYNRYNKIVRILWLIIVAYRVFDPYAIFFAPLSVLPSMVYTISGLKFWSKSLFFSFSDKFDDVVSEIMLEQKGEDNKLQALREALSVTSAGVKYEVIPGSGVTSLLLGLNHSQKNMRVLAVKHLIATAKENTVSYSSQKLSLPIGLLINCSKFEVDTTKMLKM